MVNGELIDDSVIRMEEDELRPKLRQAMPDENPKLLESRTREWARENAIERVLLRQAAMADPEPLAPEELDRRIEQLRPPAAPDAEAVLPGGRDDFRLQMEAQLRVERFTARLTAKLVPPRYKEISEYYREHRDQFFTPVLIRVAHIIKNVDEQTTDDAALEQMRAIQARLQQGENFAEVADQTSDCPGRGGDLGYFPRGQMVEEFESVVFALEPGQCSDIFRTPFGYHIAKLYDRKPEGLRPLDEVKDNIGTLLFDQKKQRRIEQFLDTLRAKATIEQ